jgi:(p)ppGpp synthase/HD superfamily hydrolase
MNKPFGLGGERTFPIFMNYPVDSLVDRAAILAHHAHQVLMDHRRKYDGTPYISHPMAVAQMVAEFGGTDEMVAAALLHDTLEDTPLDPRLIFNLDDTGEVLDLVIELTDISRPENGNRAIRKTIDRLHIAQASEAGQNIKLCDLIHNAQNIQDFDPGFAKVYRSEMRLLLPMMTKADISLKKQLEEILAKYP